MLGADHPVHASGSHELHATGAALANGSEQFVGEEEDAGDMVCGNWSVESAGVCGAVATECYGKRVVLHIDRAGW